MADETKTKPADETKTKPAATEKSSSKQPKNGPNLKEATPLEEGTVVGLAKQTDGGGKTDNYVWVEGTGESRHMPKGKKYEVNRAHADKLISKNAAKETTAPAKPKPAAAKKTKDTDEDDD